MNTITEHLDGWRIANLSIGFLIALMVWALVEWFLPSNSKTPPCGPNCIVLQNISEGEISIEMQSSAEEGDTPSSSLKNVKAQPASWHKTVSAIQKMEEEIRRGKKQEEPVDARTTQSRGNTR